MTFEFFTCGGGQFWEDVFFYQKWRIQRNCHSKIYRLLDNWDIRRAEGSFEECRKAFLEAIEIYEIPRQRGHMIVMLHGLGDTKNIFKPLWREALKQGYLAAAINYPSTQKRIDSHVRQLDFFLNHLEDVQEVSFVTKGCGGIILRSLFNLNSEWKQKLKIGRIVQICPPNQGSGLIAMLGRNKVLRFIAGPMAEEMPADYILNYIPNFPASCDVGVIDSMAPLTRACERLFAYRGQSGSDDLVRLDGVSDGIFIKNSRANVLKNPQVIAETLNFLKNGRFEK